MTNVRQIDEITNSRPDLRTAAAGAGLSGGSGRMPEMGEKLSASK